MVGLLSVLMSDQSRKTCPHLLVYDENNGLLNYIVILHKCAVILLVCFLLNLSVRNTELNFLSGFEYQGEFIPDRSITIEALFWIVFVHS